MYIGYLHPSMALAETGNVMNADEVWNAQNMIMLAYKN